MLLICCKGGLQCLVCYRSDRVTRASHAHHHGQHGNVVSLCVSSQLFAHTHAHRHTYTHMCTPALAHAHALIHMHNHSTAVGLGFPVAACARQQAAGYVHVYKAGVPGTDCSERDPALRQSAYGGSSAEGTSSNFHCSQYMFCALEVIL